MKPKIVITAVVKDLRSELSLINPDYRRVGRMIADGLEALLNLRPPTSDPERIPEPVEVRTAEPPAVRARKKKESDRSDRSDRSV